MATVLITGANRGIGFALAERYAASFEWRVIAVTRHAVHADELAALIERSAGRVRAVEADIAEAHGVERLAAGVGSETIDLLINSAGVAGGTEFGAIGAQDLIDVFSVNVFAPLLLTQALRSQLAPGAKVVNMSSVLGSIQAGGERADALTYGMSKAALNMLSVKLATVLRSLDVAVISMHPGGVRTRLGGNKAPLSAQAAAESMLQVIAALDIENSGAFLAYDGSVIPW